MGEEGSRLRNRGCLARSCPLTLFVHTVTVAFTRKRNVLQPKQELVFGSFAPGKTVPLDLSAVSTLIG